MKKSVLLMMLLASIATVSCSDDDDAKDITKNISGQYAGYTVASSRYFSNQVAPDQKLTITSVSADKVDVNFVSSTWGTITIPSATVTESGSDYMIVGEGTSLMGMEGNAKEYVCNLSGKIVKGEADLTFTCPAVMGGLNIEFMQGEIPAAIVVPGTYSGYTTAASKYFQDMTAGDQTLTITAGSDNTYDVSYISDTWGEFTISGVTAKLENNVFKLEGTGKTMMGMEGNVKEYVCEFTGSIDVEKENPTFTFTAPAVMGGLSITFKPGQLPQE
ncbi:MAG: calycin-like domain-containing protein [Bacteroides sp.]|nr:calycin-like domain-containing protein [Bacteroides sp.]